MLLQLTADSRTAVTLGLVNAARLVVRPQVDSVVFRPLLLVHSATTAGSEEKV